jgi:hypothetical protein
MKASRYNEDSELFTSWSLGVGRGHNRENYIYIIMFILKKNSSPEPAGQFQSNLVQTYCMMGIQVYSNEGQSPLQRADNHKSAK